MTRSPRTYETRTFLDEAVPVELVGDVLAFRMEASSAMVTCRLERLRPQVYGSYGTRYENVYLPVEDAGVATIRLDFCTPEMVRVRFAPGERVPANTLTGGPGNTPMVVGRFDDPVAVDAHEEAETITLTTSALEIVLHKRPWQMCVYAAGYSGACGRAAPGREIFATRSRRFPAQLPKLDFEFDPSWSFYHRYAYPLGVARREGEWPEVFESFDLAPDEHIYGLGESYLGLDKRGQRVDLWNEEVYNNTSAGAYKRIPFLASTRGYGLFINTSFPMTMHMGDLTAIAGSIIVHGCAALDYYLIYGPTLKEILSRYTDITGKPGLPPKWTFGHWMSRITYNAQAEVEHVADELRARRIPTDVIHIDTGWFTEESNCDLTFDPERFPDPAGMMARLREQGFRVSLWQWPNLLIGNRVGYNAMYLEAKSKGYLVKRTDGQVYHQAGYKDDAACLDYSDPEMVAWIQAKFKALFQMGASAIKVDFGEGAPVDGVYHGYPGAAMHNLYALLYNQAIFEATEDFFGAGNAAIWARSAWAGSQRYPVHWSGDGVAMWRDLPCTLRSGLSLGLSGFPFWSHDLGGFVGNPTPDLYARWVQLGMFSSHARAHGFPPREPWHYGARTEAIYRQYAELRYRLLPYIYSQAVESARASLPMLRALVLEYQNDPNVAHIEDEYLFGDSLLVAPIMDETGLRRVYLPAGDWVDYWSKAVVHGRRWLTVEAPLEILPLWVRAGAIIPLGPVQQYVDEKPLDPLTVELYAPGATDDFVIHDQGRPEIGIAYTRAGDTLTVTIDPTPGAVELVCYGLNVSAASREVGSFALRADTNGTLVVCFDGRNGGTITLRADSPTERAA